VFRGGCGAITADGQKTPDVVHSDPGRNAYAGYFFLPAADGPYYFHIHFAGGVRGYTPRFQKDPERAITVYMYGLDQPLARVLNLRDITDWNGVGNELPLNERYQLIPRAKVLVTIGSGRDKLTLCPLDLDQAIDEAGIDFLTITSSPPGTFCPGNEFKYPIRARSKSGGLKFTLESGPNGMKVGADGVVTWKVPAAFAEAEVQVIIGVKDAAGKEAFHNFRLTTSDKVEQYVPDPEPEPAKAPPKVDAKSEGPRGAYKLPAIPTGPEIAAPVIDRRIEVPVAHRFDTVVAGGDGRYLVLHGKAARKAIVFDVSIASVARTIDLVDENAVVAAGMNQMLIYRPTTNEIEKLSLATGASEGKKAIALKGVTDMVMGSASAGPLFVRAENRAELFDLESLAAMDLPRAEGFPFTHGRVWVSANGRVFGNTVTRATGSFARVAVLQESSIQVRSELASVPYVAPGPDGKVVYIGGFGEHTTDFKVSNSYGRTFEQGSDRAHQFVPAHSTDYFLMLHVGVGPSGFYPSARSTTRGLTIWHREQRKAVATLEDMLEMGAELSESDRLPMLAHYVPDARVVVAVPPDRRSLAVYPVKLAGIAVPPKKAIAWRLPAVPAAPPVKAIAPKDRMTIDVPGYITKVAIGGAGRFLIYQVEDRRLAVFDVTQSKFIHEIKVDESIASYAAGLDKLVVMQQGPNGNSLRRYDLASGKMEALAGCGNDRIHLYMGSASDGPVFVVGRNGLAAFDLATLAPLKLPGDSLNTKLLDYDRVAISADGRMMVVAPRVGQTARPVVLQFTETGVKETTGESGPVSSVSIAPDGKHIFLGFNGIFGPDLKKVNDVVWSPDTVASTGSVAYFFAPAAEGAYYLHLHLGARAKAENFAADPQYGLTVYKYGNDKPLGRLPNVLGQTNSAGEWLRNLKPHGVYHFLPSSKLLVAVDTSMKKLHLIPLDPENIPAPAVPEPTPKTSPKTTPKKGTPKRPPGEPATAATKPFKLAPLPEPLPFKPATDPKTFTFAEPAQMSPARVRVGGDGRFLLVQRNSQKVDVFDLNEGKVVRQIEFPVRSTTWVAGMTKLFAYDQETRGIRRFDLLTGKEELSRGHPQQLMPVALGAATDGPILCREGPRFRFVDGDTLEVMELNAPELAGGPEFGNKTIWASADGRSYGVGMGGTGFVGPAPAGRLATITFRLGPTGVQKSSGDFPSAYAVPDPTGRYLFAGGHGVYDLALKKVSDVVRSEDPSPREPPIHFYVPARQGPFYYRYPVANVPPGPGFPGGPGVPQMPPGPQRPGNTADIELSIYAYGQLKPIAQIRVPDPFAGELFSPQRVSALPELVQLIPAAKVIAIIPSRADKIHLVPFDPGAAMAKSGVEVPWVISSPPRSFRPGDTITYPIKLNGKADGAKYTLDEPAAGMSMTADGSFTWRVPADAPAEVRVAVRVKSGGAECVHSFLMTRN
jgi:hypothetical protein